MDNTPMKDIALNDKMLCLGAATKAIYESHKLKGSIALPDTRVSEILQMVTNIQHAINDIEYLIEFKRKEKECESTDPTSSP